MRPVRALRKLLSLPPSRRRQWFTLRRDRLVTKYIYGPRLLRCGAESIVQKPLFWTPEYIELGDRVLIWRDCRIEGIDEYGSTHYAPSIQLGNDVSLQQGCHFTAAESLIIGSGTTVLCGVVITDVDHEYEALGVNVREQRLSVRPTQIGRNCLIGAGARIQAGTRLGDQCIVGANAVVRGDFPDYSVIAGVPARILKRYDADSGSWRKTNSEGQFL